MLLSANQPLHQPGGGSTTTTIYLWTNLPLVGVNIHACPRQRDHSRPQLVLHIIEVRPQYHRRHRNYLRVLDEGAGKENENTFVRVLIEGGGAACCRVNWSSPLSIYIWYSSTFWVRRWKEFWYRWKASGAPLSLFITTSAVLMSVVNSTSTLIYLKHVSS